MVVSDAGGHITEYQSPVRKPTLNSIPVGQTTMAAHDKSRYRCTEASTAVKSNVRLHTWQTDEGTRYPRSNRPLCEPCSRYQLTSRTLLLNHNNLGSPNIQSSGRESTTAESDDQSALVESFLSSLTWTPTPACCSGDRRGGLGECCRRTPC